MNTEALLTNAPAAAAMQASSPPLSPVRSRSIPTVFLVLYALLLALGLGLGSAYWIMQGDPPFGSMRRGAWQTWPSLGSPAADPYMRAILARRGDVPLATGEGMGFTATVDSEGRPLDAACSYAVGSVSPMARLWSLTLYDEDGRLPVTDLGRRSFTSAEVLRDAQERFTITLSRDLHAGNWIQLPPSGSFMVTLRLYDPPGAALSNFNESDFPAIQRLGCGA
jgi:hypothetical protein